MCRFSQDNKEKIGNTIIFIAEKTRNLSKTKLLKILFLMEETMVEKHHIPFLSVPYEVWTLGPVQKDIFIELSNGGNIFKDYIAANVNKNYTYIKPLKKFDDNEFSDAELEVMQCVMDTYGKYDSAQLVKILHKEGSLWYNTAKKHGLLDAFNKKTCNSSNVRIDFGDALDEKDKEFYEECLALQSSSNNAMTQANV